MDARLLAALADKAKLVLLPANADPDAVGAACGLVLATGGTVLETDGVSATGKRIASAASVAIQAGPPTPLPPRAFVVDTATPIKLGAVAKTLRAPIVIDHHAEASGWGSDAVLHARPERSSTCEVVLDLLDEAGIAVPQAAAQALLVGLLADTKRYRYANRQSFEATLRLVDHGARLAEAVAILDDRVEERSHRIARLTAAARCEIHKAGWLVVATSEVASFEASAAQGLVDLGADVAFVAATRGDEVRVSARASPRVGERVHLGRVMQRAAEALGPCEGGGHAGAAGLNGRAAARSALEACLGSISAPLGPLAKHRREPP